MHKHGDTSNLSVGGLDALCMTCHKENAQQLQIDDGDGGIQAADRKEEGGSRKQEAGSALRQRMSCCRLED